MIRRLCLAGAALLVFVPTARAADPWTASQPLGLTGTPGLAANALAVDEAGDAAMVYSVVRDASCERILVYLAVRRAGSSQIRSTRLADGAGPFPRVAAAVNQLGDAVAVWSQAGTLWARVRTA